MPELRVQDVEKHFEQLAALEKDFDKVDLEILRETIIKQRPLFEKRNAITSAIPGFWPHVLEDASGTIGFDEHVTPEDAEVLTHLVELNVTRPDIEKGDPRNIEITFKFKDNDFMPAQTVTKLFTYQPSDQPGLTGLISTPTAIAWKKGKDLTFGVNQAAIEAFEERKSKAASKKGKSPSKLGEKEMKLFELLNKNSQSFFTWFSFTGSHHELGEADDSEDDNTDDDDMPTGPIETFPYGDELAIQFADDLYPAAVKYFTSSLEESDDEDDADIDLDSDLEEQLAKQGSHAGCGVKHKHNHSHGETVGEPAKKKARK